MSTKQDWTAEEAHRQALSNSSGHPRGPSPVDPLVRSRDIPAFSLLRRRHWDIHEILSVPFKANLILPIGDISRVKRTRQRLEWS
mmetsp:Transcript_17905/g.37173  ORF Transcript_17905/g.37173 Transcript_17905/m.37173 type:complete len:85 (+) Transcript_17905:1265-1519(+)